MSKEKDEKEKKEEKEYKGYINAFTIDPKLHEALDKSAKANFRTLKLHIVSIITEKLESEGYDVYAT